MSDMYGSLFENGRWEWDDLTRKLVFVSSVAVSKKKQTQKNVEVKAKNLRVYLDMHFADTMDPKEMATFRRVFYRRVRSTEVDVVRIQDVRDVVMYQCSNSLPGDIIDLLHLEAVERFTRALILYMQSFLKVLDALHERAPDRDKRLTLGDLTYLERSWQRNLNDLRTLVAREHCCMLMAADTMFKRFHHLGGGLSTTGSQGERDIRYFELLWRFAARMVHVALFRRSYSLIEAEINRVFRSTVFSAHLKRPQRSKKKMFETPATPRRSAAVSMTVNKPMSYEYRTLYGEGQEDRRIFHTHSPACMTALADHDFRLMATGNIDFIGGDERFLKLWQALTLPEEMIPGSSVVLGIVGLPRAAFDTMLTPLNRIAEDDEEKEDDDSPAPPPITSSVMPQDDPQQIDTHSLQIMELPSPGPRIHAPSNYPRQRPPHSLRQDDFARGQAQTIIQLKEKAAKDRQKSRLRWRRWEQAGMRSKRRLSYPPPSDSANKTGDGINATASQDIDGEQPGSAKRSPQQMESSPPQSSRQARPESEGMEMNEEEEGWDAGE